MIFGWIFIIIVFLILLRFFLKRPIIFILLFVGSCIFIVNNQPSESKQSENKSEIVKESSFENSDVNSIPDLNNNDYYYSRDNYNSYQNTSTNQYKRTYNNTGKIRVGAICNDGTTSNATGRGACSHHGGVAKWIYK